MTQEAKSVHRKWHTVGTKIRDDNHEDTENGCGTWMATTTHRQLDPDQEGRERAAEIVARWNALEGMRPEALAGFIEATESLLEADPADCSDAWDHALAALAALKEKKD